jgi:hypothetical protein
MRLRSEPLSDSPPKQLTEQLYTCGLTLLSDTTEQNQNQENQEDRAQTARRIVTPSPAVRPSRQDGDKQDKKYQKQQHTSSLLTLVQHAKCQTACDPMKALQLAKLRPIGNRPGLESAPPQRRLATAVLDSILPHVQSLRQVMQYLENI